jgi:hypothetical protein
MIAQMRESSAAERRLLLDEQRAAAANAALERQQMQQILLQVAAHHRGPVSELFYRPDALAIVFTVYPDATDRCLGARQRERR